MLAFLAAGLVGPALASDAPGPKHGWVTPGKVRALAFVPVPGFPSMLQGDWGNAGLSLAVTAPAVALWVGAATTTAEWRAESWAVSAGGAYAATVVVNQVMGMRSYRRARPLVAVHPQRGGARVVVHATF